MVEPTNKKRKIEVNGHANGHALSGKQESFSAVLEQLEAEEDANGGETLIIRFHPRTSWLMDWRRPH